MTMESNSSQSPENKSDQNLPADNVDSNTDEKEDKSSYSEKINTLQQKISNLEQSYDHLSVKPRALIFTLGSITITFIGIIINNPFLGILGTIITLVLSIALIWPWLIKKLKKWFSRQDIVLLLGFIGLSVGIIGLLKFTDLGDVFLGWGKKLTGMLPEL